MHIDLVSARLRATAAAVLLATACGGVPTVVSGQGSVGSAPDVESALAKASSVAGHPVVLVIDSAVLAPHPGKDVEPMVVGAAEVVARDLAGLRARDPAAFAAEVPRLARIECRYGDGGPQAARWEGSTLVLTRKYRWEVLARGDVEGALRDDFYTELGRRFGSLEPAQVAPGDRALYFVYVVRDAPDDEGGGDRLPDATVARVLGLAAVVGASDPPLAGKLATWLLARASSMAEADPASEAPEARQTRAVWVAWLKGAIPSWGAAEKLRLAQAVFGNRWGYRGGQGRTAGDALEGFDVFAFGLSVADAWVAGGHPTDHLDDPAHALFTLVLEPPVLEKHDRLPRLNFGSSPWLRAAFDKDPQGRRLAEALAARNDPRLLGEVIYNLPRRDDGPSPRASLLHELERFPATWRATMVLLIGQGVEADGCDDGLVDEANRVWRDVPAFRGTALDVIACKESRARGVSASYFVQFPRLYGQPVAAALFGAFLDDGPDAMRLADMLWPAMSPGWSRAAAIVPRLDAFLADPRVKDGEDGEPMKTLEALTAQLCADGPGEVARLHDALAARARRSPDEARALARVIDDTSPGQCKPRR